MGYNKALLLQVNAGGDKERSRAFYQDLLGFKLSDRIVSQ